MLQDSEYQQNSVIARLIGGALSCLICLLSAGCQHVSEKGARTDSLTTGQLAGTYLLTDIEPIGEGQLLSPGTGLALRTYINALEYSFLSFDQEGRWWQVANQELQEGRYMLSADRLTTETSDFYNVRLGKQSLTLSVQRQIEGQVIVFRLKAYRLNFSVDDLRFSALAKATFRRPTRSETDAQIRERVRNSLYFYSLFFRTVYTNQFNRFKPAAIRIPIRFARAGIRIVYRFDSTANWTTLYATTSDAKKAYVLFRQAQKAAGTYPAGETMIHKFSLTLQKMGNAL